LPNFSERQTSKNRENEHGTAQVLWPGELLSLPHCSVTNITALVANVYKMVIFESCVQVGCGAHPDIIQWLPEVLFLGIKQPEREADSTTPSSFKVKNRWSFALPLLFYEVKLSDFTALFAF
jgi:hypothetical protein